MSEFLLSSASVSSWIFLGFQASPSMLLVGSSCRFPTPRRRKDGSPSPDKIYPLSWKGVIFPYLWPLKQLLDPYTFLQII